MEKNWAAEGKISAIKNQSLCGSCEAHGVVAVMEAMLKINHNLDIELSEADLFFCGRTTNTCAGGSSSMALINSAKKRGVTTEEMFPYMSAFNGSPDSGNCILNADRDNHSYAIVDYVRLKSDAAVKNWIVNKGPVNSRIAVYSDFLHYYESADVYHRNPAAEFVAGHGIAIVGFSDEGQYWIIKNSWNITWGVNGYGKIGYGEV